MPVEKPLSTDLPPLTTARQAMAVGAQVWSEGRIAAAAQAFAAATRMAPLDDVPHGNLGAALRRLGKPAAAAASHRRALAIRPDSAGHHSNLGNALRDLGCLEEAVVHFRRSVVLAPDDTSYQYNLALGLRDCCLHEESLAMLEQLAAARPDDPEVAWDLALSRLYLTDYRRGFAGYEARHRLDRAVARTLPGERWDGVSDLAGKTLFLLAEQGFGDALQFARFVPLVAARGARVVLEAMPELAPLLAAQPGVAAVVIKGTPPPDYDVWVPLLSLAHLLGVEWDTIPAPSLVPPARLARPLPRPPGTRLTIGLVWAGKTTPRDRSWPLETLLPLLEDPRFAWFSLQLGPRAADLAALGADALVRDLGALLNGFAATAAVMADLDLMISIDSAPAHLAGALGRPVWVLLRKVSDWRWRDEGETTPWYPSMRLFRQADPSDFAGPVAEVRAALTELGRP